MKFYSGGVGLRGQAPQQHNTKSVWGCILPVCPKDAITEYHGLGDSNCRNASFPHSFGG